AHQPVPKSQSLDQPHSTSSPPLKKSSAQALPKPPVSYRGQVALPEHCGNGYDIRFALKIGPG
ncbi:MAG: hypothetical protein OSB05_13710, partial [Akkermansiaceae bacterium]|nr:hypothetical protein [Akkermansiaceae bacterium]